MKQQHDNFPLCLLGNFQTELRAIHQTTVACTFLSSLLLICTFGQYLSPFSLSKFHSLVSLLRGNGLQDHNKDYSAIVTITACCYVKDSKLYVRFQISPFGNLVEDDTWRFEWSN